MSKIVWPLVVVRKRKGLGIERIGTPVAAYMGFVGFPTLQFIPRREGVVGRKRIDGTHVLAQSIGSVPKVGAVQAGQLVFGGFAKGKAAFQKDVFRFFLSTPEES